jgi:RND family efflux transporter MFP subunit
MKLNKRLITGIIGGVLVLLVAGVLISGTVKKRAAQAEVDTKIALQNSPRAVRTEPVQALVSEKERSYPGTVNASEVSALSFRVGGPLTEVNVTPGEPVKKGDLLMQIDPRDFQDRIQSLEAQLAGASALQKKAQQDYARISKLFEEKVVPQSDLDGATSALDATDASVKALTAQLQMARHALADTSLRAPYDGTVAEQRVENHEMVAPGQLVLRFHNIEALEVTVSIPESEIATRQLEPKVPARITFPAIGGKTRNARLKEWSSTAHPLTRTYAVTFEFNAPDGFKILPGMSAELSWLAPRAGSPRFAVPASALFRHADGSTCVWVWDQSADRAEARRVTVGESVGSSRVVITEGLSEGERVVVSGSRLIYENLPLKSVAIR